MTEPLFIVPARGGSTGIPRKCVRMLGDQPLLWWTLDTLEGLGRIIVATDDDEVAMLARRWGAEVFRDTVPPSNDRTLDHVVWGVVRVHGADHAIVATVQPTSPFLERKTILQCLLMASRSMSAMTVAQTGGVEFADITNPTLVTEWATRQQSDRWRLTGGCVASPRQWIGLHRRWGEPLHLIPVMGAEAIDLDSRDDWAAAEAHLKTLRVAYRVDGGGELGLGHVYRAATLLGKALHVEGTLFMDAKRYPEGVSLARKLGLTIYEAGSEIAEPYDVLVSENRPVVTEEIKAWQRGGGTFVCIEDRSEDGLAADLCFNDLDGPPMDGPTEFRGPKYAVIRDEFLSVRRADRPDTIVVTFGGTDPGDLTRMTLGALESLPPHPVVVIVGPGYPRTRELPLRSKHQIQMVQSPMLLSPYFERAKLAITSCGRTVYELVACQVPTLALPQNPHELRHASLSYDCGVWSVPQMAKELSLGAITETIKQCLLPAWQMRAVDRMSQVDVRHGAERFWALVLDRHRARQLNPNVRMAA